MGFLPHVSLTAARTARRTASATSSADLRPWPGMLRSVPSTASSTTSSMASPFAVSAGTPSRTAWGSLRSSPRRDKHKDTITMPTAASLRRARTGPSDSSTSRRPSRKRRPTGASSITAASGLSRKISPSSTEKMVLTPISRASSACAFRWRASPCIGTATWGRSQRYMRRSSSRLGWPETCTKASPSVRISQPLRARLFWMRPTAFSLPGIVREEKITRSPLSSEMSGCSSSEMRESAARASP